MLRDIQEDDKSEVEELRQAYELIVQTAVTQSQYEIEHALLSGDEKTAVQEGIKLSAIRVTKKLFEQCCQEIEQAEKDFWHDKTML